jgi:hypothetical protein
MKKFIVILLLALSAVEAQAQDISERIWWDATFGTLFDNREYKSEFSESKTLFSYKFMPQLGLFTRDNRHSLITGVDITRDMGVSGKDQPDPEFFMYYFHNGARLKAYAGTFPRKYMRGFPREFFSRSLEFYDPVMEGVLLKYKGRRWNVEFAGDWYAKKTETQREQFMLYSWGQWQPYSGWRNYGEYSVGDRTISSSKLRQNRLSMGYYASMQHFAASEIEPGVVDNMLVKPWVGYNYRNWGGSVAWTQSFQRDRLNGNKWDMPGGFWVGAWVRWKSLTADNQLYLGDDLMPYWNRYGCELYKGDPFFRTTHGIYNRLEIGWQPRISDTVFLKISSVHHYDGKTWNWQQTAVLTMNINAKN